MRIGIDIRNIGKKRTGDEVVFFNLVKNFAEIDSSNRYYLFTDFHDRKILKEMKKSLGIEDKKNFKIISLEGDKFVWNFWAIQRYLRKHPVDAYLTQYVTPFFVPKKTKVVTIIHDVSFMVFPDLVKRKDLFFLKALIPLAIKRADKVVGVSKFTMREVRKYFKVDSKKVTWMHNAVSDDFLKNIDSMTSEKKEDVKRKFDLPEKFILYIGTLQPRKNIPVLIEAFAKAKDRLPGVKLVLAGGRGHNYDPKIDEAVEKYGLHENVIFPGFIEEADKPALLALASCICSPSLYEGFGIPVLEGFAAGVPVIASNIPSHEEVSNGAAILFDSRNPDELADDLAKIMNDEKLREDVIMKEKKRASFFSWKKTAEKMQETFKNIA